MRGPQFSEEASQFTALFATLLYAADVALMKF